METKNQIKIFFLKQIALKIGNKGDYLKIIASIKIKMGYLRDTFVTLNQHEFKFIYSDLKNLKLQIKFKFNHENLNLSFSSYKSYSI